MNSKIIIGIVIVLVIIGSVFYFTQKQYQPSQQPNVQIAGNTIAIKNFSFTPDTLTVSQGTKVIWTNQDAAVHKIKSGTFNSSDLNQGNTFEFTFDTKGTFEYSCAIHPSMTGKIVVE